MGETESYYEVLGISHDADHKTIKEAFRRLTLEYHPDRSDKPGTEERYRQITEAYAVLSDPQRRKQYDTRGPASVADLSPEDLVGGIDLADLFGWSGLGGSLFERFFAGHRRSPRSSPAGADVEIRVHVPLDRIAHGGKEEVRLEHPRACSTCRGSGASPTAPKLDCTECGGSGTLVRTERRGRTLFQRVMACPACGGQGRVIKEACPDCAGRGRVQGTHTLAIEVPRGLEEAAILRVPGQGLPSPDLGGPPGDLYIVVQTQSDPRFVRRGSDLWRTETFEPPALVLGTKVEVPTLDGSVIVKIPPRTPPETVLRLTGKGLPSLDTGRVGDLKLAVQVRFADDLTDEEIGLYERLQQLAARRAAGEQPPAAQGALDRSRPEPEDEQPQAEQKAKRKKRRWWWPFGRWR